MNITGSIHHRLTDAGTVPYFNRYGAFYINESDDPYTESSLVLGKSTKTHQLFFDASRSWTGVKVISVNIYV